MFGVLGNMRNDFPAISDSRTRSSPAKPRELAPRPWPDREQGLRHRTPRASNRRPPSEPRPAKNARRGSATCKRPPTDPRSPRKRPRTQKAARPRGGRRPFFFAKTRGAPANEGGGDPSGPPLPGALFAPPRPLPAQRAPGAGGALVSHRVAPAVPSALAGLTSGFGMGPGVPRPPGPPAPGGRCGAGSEGAGLRSGRPGGRTALKEGAL